MYGHFGSQLYKFASGRNFTQKSQRRITTSSWIVRSPSYSLPRDAMLVRACYDSVSFGEEAGSQSNTKSPGPRPSSTPSDILIHAAIWPQQIWAENWGTVPLWGRGTGSAPNTMWPGPRPTCVPSLILIRPTVWPQCTNVTDRQDRQDRQDRTDNGPIA